MSDADVRRQLSIGSIVTQPPGKKTSTSGLLNRLSRSISGIRYLRIPGKGAYNPEEGDNDEISSTGGRPSNFFSASDSWSSGDVGDVARNERNSLTSKTSEQSGVPVRHKSSVIAHRAAVQRARSRSLESDATNVVGQQAMEASKQEMDVGKQKTELGKQDIEVGKQVTVTSDELMLESSVKAAGMMWPKGPSGRLWTRKLGVSGTIIKVDYDDGTVELSDEIGWVPICALQGFELWKGPDSSQSTAPENEELPQTTSAGRAPASSMPSGKVITEVGGGSEEDLQSQVNPEVTPEATVSSPIECDSIVDQEAKALGTKRKSKIKRASKIGGGRLSSSGLSNRESVPSSPIRTRLSFFDDLEDSADEDYQNATSQSPSNLSALSPSSLSALRTSQGSSFSLQELDRDANLKSNQQSQSWTPQAQMYSSEQSVSTFRPPYQEARRISEISLLSNDSWRSLAAQDTQQMQSQSNTQTSSRSRPPDVEPRRSSQSGLLAEDLSQPRAAVSIQQTPSPSKTQRSSRSRAPTAKPRSLSQSSLLAVDLSQPTAAQNAQQATSQNDNQSPSRLRPPDAEQRRISQASLLDSDDASEDLDVSVNRSAIPQAETVQVGTDKVEQQPRRTSARVRRSSKKRRSSLGSLGGRGMRSRMTFVEDDLLSPPTDEVKEKQADHLAKKDSALGRLLDERGEDSMDGEIFVSASSGRPSPLSGDDGKMAALELQKDLDDGRTSSGMKSTDLPTPSAASRCSWFSEGADSDADEVCSGFGLALSTEDAQASMQASAEGNLLQTPDAEGSLNNLLKRLSVCRISSEAGSKSRHINWRQSRVQSVCQSHLLDEAMARVAVGEQAMHPERAKSGFSLFKRMKNLLEAQDFDDSTGRKVIENIFFDSIPKKYVEICSVEQVLRIDLLKRFLKKVSDESGSIECTFHGTQEKYVQDILDIGLCPNLCATGAYGRGAYVGTHAGVAHQYADPNPEGWRHMCVVLVLVGQKVVKGKEGEQCPATALDSLANPTQYCFVDEDRLYISHLITYRVLPGAARRIGGGWDDPFQRKLTTAVSKAAKMRNKSGRR